MVRRSVALLAVVFLGACSGSSTGPSGGGGGGGDGRAIVAEPSFQTHIQEIFDRRGCSGSGCHGAAAAAGLRLSSGSAYDALVNVPATSEAFVRVAPGDAQNSYLVIKVEGRQVVGARMPLNGAALDDIDRTNLRNWISNGAPRN